MGDARSDYDLIVLGGGPGGYVAALRAAQLGLRTALVERERVGGVCLNWGCIPTKVLLHAARLWREIRGARRFGLTVEEASCHYAAVQRTSRQTAERLVKGIERLLERAGVDLVTGPGQLAGRDGERLRIEVRSEDRGAPARLIRAERLILATGGRPRPLAAVATDGARVIFSREALQLTEVPERLLVIGGGPIGLEFADLFRTFGAEVTVVEILSRILPMEDPEVSEALRRALVRRGIRIRTATRVLGAEPTDDGIACRIASDAEAAAGDPPGSFPAVAEEQRAVADHVLVAVGVIGNTAGIGLESVALEPVEGFLEVDDRMRTTAPGVYAIGDVTGPPLLAHRASAQGICAAEHAAGREPPAFDRGWIPAAVFTHPPVASVGATESEARHSLGEIRVGRFPFSASGKALTEGEITGFVKVILEPEGRRLLGGQVIGPGAPELIAELALIGRCRLDPREVRRTPHAHPTLSEAIVEALGAALGEGLHI